MSCLFFNLWTSVLSKHNGTWHVHRTNCSKRQMVYSYWLAQLARHCAPRVRLFFTSCCISPIVVSHLTISQMPHGIFVPAASRRANGTKRIPRLIEELWGMLRNDASVTQPRSYSWICSLLASWTTCFCPQQQPPIEPMVREEDWLAELFLSDPNVPFPPSHLLDLPSFPFALPPPLQAPSSRSQSLPSQGPDACSHPGATALIPLSAFQLHGDTFVAATQPRHHSQGQSGKRCWAGLTAWSRVSAACIPQVKEDESSCANRRFTCQKMVSIVFPRKPSLVSDDRSLGPRMVINSLKSTWPSPDTSKNN